MIERIGQGIALLLVFSKRRIKTYVYRESGIYNHSGDDGKEVPPVLIPNTEVKLFYAESTCKVLLGG